jgi:thiol-disulfide isomerase/thioredoxin
MFRRFILVLLLTGAYLHDSFAGNKQAEDFELTLSSEAAIGITRFGEGGDRILWIPSEHGINKERHYELLEALAEQHYEVWLAATHESYFIPAGRSSYTRIPVDDIAELIQKSLPEDNRKLFIISSGRGAVLSLLALNNWLDKTGGSEKFGGIVLLNPNFQADTPTPGKAMTFLPVVDNTQLPVFIIQPEKSNKFWYLDELVTRLSNGGSKVYSEIIAQAGDGYHVRADARDSEKQKARELPQQLAKAIAQLAQTKVARKKQHNAASGSWTVSPLAESLQPYPEKTAAPVLELEGIEGKKYRLQDHHGKVVLVNFWASWCPPCVKEIPSLGRLQKAFSKKDLLVLSVAIGESKQQVESFLKQFPADFPVLLDSDGITVKPWKIIAFPTTFVIDQQGIIQLAYFGGLEWDNPAVVTQLQALLKD